MCQDKDYCRAYLSVILNLRVPYAMEFTLFLQVFFSIHSILSLVCILYLFHFKIFNQIIKCLNFIINENKPYNLRLCTFTFHIFQEKNLNLNRDSNSDLLTIDLEVRVRIPVQVQIFLLEFMKYKCTKAQIIRFIFINNEI